MSVTTERIVGKQCTVALNSTTVSHWNKYSVKKTLNTEDARSATAEYDQFVDIYKACEVTVEGYRGGDDAFLDTVDISSVVTISGTNFPSMTGYGNAKVTEKTIDQEAAPGTWSMTIRYGALNVTVPSGD